MPLKHIKRLFLGNKPRIPREEALKVFQRDQFKCQYCGLDGLASFENWMLLTIDHVHPYSRGGPRHSHNQVTACQPCNLIKGTHHFGSIDDARQFVMAKRSEWRDVYEKDYRPATAKAAGAAAG